MDIKSVRALMALLRSAIYDTPISDPDVTDLDSATLQKTVDMAKHHDVIHLLASAFTKNGLHSDALADPDKSVFTAVYRNRQMTFELSRLCNALKKAGIPFIPLKGSVLRGYYPEPWMRTSCDIDVLVRESDLERAVAYLVDNLDYNYEHTFTHDVSLSTKSGVHVELHYNLMQDEPIKSSRAVLDGVWDLAVKREEYEYELPDEVFYFYHIAHMAKHFENGGCGIRPFIDLKILNRMPNFDTKKRSDLLRVGGLSEFAEQAQRLCEVWFGDAEHTDVTRNMEQYILRGGVYGVIENHIAVQQQKHGGKLKYAISKIWLPYDVIKFYYPRLGKHRIFTPLMQLLRWCRLVFGGHLKRTAGELSYNSQITKEKARQTKDLLDSVGL